MQIMSTIVHTPPPPLMAAACSICLDDMKETDESSLYCGHTFHTVCVEPWLLQQGSCPLCRSTDSVKGIIIAADPMVALRMNRWKPVASFRKEYFKTHMSGWVAYTQADMDCIVQWVNLERPINMALVRGASLFTEAATAAYLLVEEHEEDNDHYFDSTDASSEDEDDDYIQLSFVASISSAPHQQQPPYGNFYVE
jgi:Ring finger domain